MAEEIGKLSCCGPEGEVKITEYITIRSSGIDEVENIVLDEDGKIYKEDDTLGEALEKVRKAKKGTEREKDLCLLYNTLVYLSTKHSKWADRSYELTFKDLIKKVKEWCGDNTPKSKKCKDEPGKKDCEKRKKDGENVTWDNKTCKCVDATKKKEVIPQIRGCGYETAANYWCKDPKNTCKDGKLPKGFVSVGCYWKKVDVVLNNRYCFCTSSLCQEGGNCIRPGTYTLTGTSENFYDKVYSRAYNQVNSIAPKTRFSNESGFYAKIIDETLKEDLATVLTILHLRHYSLARKNNTYLVVYTPNGTEIGYFYNVRREDKMFSTVDFNRSTLVYRKRLSGYNEWLE